MVSPNWVLVIIQFSFLTNLPLLTITHGESVCGTQGTYKPNSAYQTNLNEALSTLPEAHNGDGYFTASSVSAQDNDTDTVYALALCPGEFNYNNCRNCVRNATYMLQQDCHNQKKASGWFRNSCLLSYSNSTFESIVLRYSELPRWDSVFQTGLENQFRLLLAEVKFDGYSKRFYSDITTLPSSRGNIDMVMQCIPNTSQNICAECLANAIDYLRTCCDGSTQVVIYYRYPCFLRYVITTVVVVNASSPTPFSSVPSPMPPTTPSTIPPQGKEESNVIGPAVAAAAVTLAFSTFLICLKFRRICSKKGEEDELFDESDDDTGEISYYRLNVMNTATNNFSVANKLGEGGFGAVYRGELSDGKKVAVKRLSQISSQGMHEFKTEVKLIIKLQHKNLVKLLGCCMKGNERLLVYEYMSNSSLDMYLFEDAKKRKELDWAKRVNIVNGIAKGLRYLHEDSRLKIIHRDLKASNVLLDEDMNPKISDFGTARIFKSNQVDANTNRVVGTYGYMAPEYAMEGMFSIKSDVYSFGVLLLEIISGKRNSRLFYQENDQNLLSYAWMLWNEGKGDELIDENLNNDCPVDEALKWLRIALLCIEEDPNDRPTMSSVTSMLEGEWKSLSEPKPPMSFAQFITSDQSSSMWNGDNFGFYSSNSTLEDTDHRGG